MAEYSPVTDMVTRAKSGDKQAWDEIVERYASLIWSICRRYRLSEADAEDVGQVVWLPWTFASLIWMLVTRASARAGGRPRCGWP